MYIENCVCMRSRFTYQPPNLKWKSTRNTIIKVCKIFSIFKYLLSIIIVCFYDTISSTIIQHGKQFKNSNIYKCNKILVINLINLFFIHMI